MTPDVSEARAARGVGWGALLVGTAVMSGIYAPQPLLAEVAAEFDRTAFEANLVVSMTTLGIALGVFPMAAISARAGRGRTIAWGLAASFLLTLATAVVSAWPVLVVVRMLMGIASSAVLVSAVVWATESVPALWGRRAAGLYVAGTTAGGMLGRLVAGIVADAWGWRAGLVVVDAAVLVTAVAGLLLVARNAAPASALPRSARAHAPRAGGRFLRVRMYTLAFLATAVYVGVFNAIVFRMLAPPFSLSLTFTSMLFVSYLAGTLSSMRTGALLDRLGLRATVGAGLVTMLVGVGLTFVEHLVAVIAGLVALAAGFFVAHAASSATVPTISPVPTTGSAWYTLLYYAGSSAGALALGAAWDRAQWTGVGIAAAALGGGALVVSLTLPRVVPPRAGSGSHIPLDKGDLP